MQMPLQLQQRPQYRGFPVPFTTAVSVDGTPNFKVTDAAAWHRCLDENLCALCSQTLEYWCWYLGSADHVKQCVVFDLGMHQECARYAAHVCPYIAYGKTYGEVVKPVEGITIVEVTPHAKLANEAVPMYLFRGRTRNAKKVWVAQYAMYMSETGSVFDPELIVRRELVDGIGK